MTIPPPSFIFISAFSWNHNWNKKLEFLYMGNSTNWNNLGSIQLQLNESLVSIPLPLGERKFHNTFTTEQKKKQ